MSKFIKVKLNKGSCVVNTELMAFYAEGEIDNPEEGVDIIFGGSALNLDISIEDFERQLGITHD